ncbi:MAG: gamma carbonic anhydrase family protein [Clostridia bacterium]|jgi:carbonic anhydrase/acetyltransferase-like protein (isoleucine patch superfamily)|nr:gamma carbonic anhydrase family protein [Clostridia bacterium]
MPVFNVKHLTPKIADHCFVADNAMVMGRVTLEEGSSVWFNCLLRGDVDEIVIGKNTNIQDGTMIHCNAGEPTIVGDNVSVGHGAILHACTIKDRVLIGMGAIILDNVEIGEGSIVAAGAIVTPRTKIPPYSLVVGTPAKVVKSLDIKAQDEARVAHALKYRKLWEEFYK